MKDLRLLPVPLLQESHPVPVKDIFQQVLRANETGDPEIRIIVSGKFLFP